ncbi:hypothetical protein R69608_00361 [Paraburkholderia nemoris]|uniref:hypothetical protein n=1 Tax=Paraburkholderia nemoris TaxID=2793076 RepID=UPI001911C5A7|nr:hypothetical protein [Paraburkholderia nemoris]MBK5146367.1 hypothetical protein [Burkholderia sp. R-69608]CAE6864039.1 hypothetical protein R69608_00361 [Paraburkholderia nemoris]
MGFFDSGNGPGAGGFTGFFNGPAAYGASGTTGTVTPDGSGLGGLMSGNLGDALGSAPTWLFGGLLPGGGMTNTQSGALGGGLSGAVAGAAPIGGASMGGFNPAPWMLGAAGLAGLGYLASRGNHQQMMGGDPVGHFAFGNPSVKFAPPPTQMPYMQFGTTPRST